MIFMTKNTDGEKTGTGHGVAMFKRLWDTDFGFSSGTSQDNICDKETNRREFCFRKIKNISIGATRILNQNPTPYNVL